MHVAKSLWTFLKTLGRTVVAGWAWPAMIFIGLPQAWDGIAASQIAPSLPSSAAIFETLHLTLTQWQLLGVVLFMVGVAIGATRLVRKAESERDAALAELNARKPVLIFKPALAAETKHHDGHSHLRFYLNFTNVGNAKATNPILTYVFSLSEHCTNPGWRMCAPALEMLPGIGAGFGVWESRRQETTKNGNRIEYEQSGKVYVYACMECNEIPPTECWLTVDFGGGYGVQNTVQKSTFEPGVRSYLRFLKESGRLVPRNDETPSDD